MTFKLVGKKIIGGQEVLVNIDNVGGANVVIPSVACESSVYVGAAVIMQGSGIAKNALADSLANSNVIGVVESKASSEICNIRVLGVSGPNFSSLDVTKEYYLSNTVAGGITTTVPTITGHILLNLGQPFSATEFLVVKGKRLIRT